MNSRFVKEINVNEIDEIVTQLQGMTCSDYANLVWHLFKQILPTFLFHLLLFATNLFEVVLFQIV